MSFKIVCNEGLTGVRPVTWRSTASDVGHRERQATPDPALQQLQAKLFELQHGTEARLNDVRQTAFEAGFSKARAEFEAELGPLLDSMSKQVKELAAVRKSLLSEAEDSLADLALRIARRIVHRELTIDPAAVQGIMNAALSSLRGHHLLKIRVHPRLESYVRSALEHNESACAGVVIVTDRSLQSDGLVFETDRGDLDASVESQLDEIRRGLTDRVGR